MIGKKFNRWTVLKIVPNRNIRDSHKYCLARCDCGKIKTVRLDRVKKGIIKSCGCLRKEITSKRFETHGLSKIDGPKNKCYGIWIGMMARCYNPKCKNYKWYGKRGIKVCNEWKDPAIFCKDVLSFGWKDGLTIDRINNDGDYEPKNIRFVTMMKQNRNKRNNVWIEFDDKRMILEDWAKELGITYNTLYWRISNGWPIDKVFSTEKFNGNRYRSNKRTEG